MWPRGLKLNRFWVFSLLAKEEIGQYRPNDIFVFSRKWRGRASLIETTLRMLPCALFLQKRCSQVVKFFADGQLDKAIKRFKQFWLLPQTRFFKDGKGFRFGFDDEEGTGTLDVTVS